MMWGWGAQNWWSETLKKQNGIRSVRKLAFPNRSETSSLWNKGEKRELRTFSLWAHAALCWEQYHFKLLVCNSSLVLIFFTFLPVAEASRLSGPPILMPSHTWKQERESSHSPAPSKVSPQIFCCKLDMICLLTVPMMIYLLVTQMCTGNTNVYKWEILSYYARMN